jgi:arylsulfatase A-like enzyme
LSFGKSILYEGGIRVPYIVQRPGVAPEDQQSNAIVSGLDILPTFVAAAGGKLPTDREYDGIDLRPYFEGKATEPTHRTLYWRHFADRAVRENQWKLIWTPKTKAHLYDISQNIEETEDRADEHPEIVQRLQEKWVTWDKKNLPPPERLIPKSLLPKTVNSPQPSKPIVDAVLRAVE